MVVMRGRYGMPAVSLTAHGYKVLDYEARSTSTLWQKTKYRVKLFVSWKGEILVSLYISTTISVLTNIGHHLKCGRGKD